VKVSSNFPTMTESRKVGNMYLFMVYVTTVLVAQTIQCQMLRFLQDCINMSVGEEIA
jgi:hypothetical protein